MPTDVYPACRTGSDSRGLSSEVGRGLRASAGSPVITADVKCLQRDGGGGGEGHRHSCFHSVQSTTHTHTSL